MGKALDAATERAAAQERLRCMLPEGSTVWTIIRHVSPSGMTRSISVVTVSSYDGESEPFDVSYWVARSLGSKVDPKNGGIKRQGCGMDMAFDLVYTLARSLYGDGYALKQRAL